MANRKNLATSTVLTAPSPAASGTSVVVQSGHGARFPAADFYATVHPDGVLPTLDNAEIVLVTNIATDTFTITRAQKDTTAKSIAIGWRISNAIYAEDVVDSNNIVENEVPGGTVNGTNAAFTTASDYVAGSLKVYKNGVRMKSGGADFTEDGGNDFTMTSAPNTGTVLVVDYLVAPSASGNADTVDGIHASTTPTNGHLLPLDNSGEYPTTVQPDLPVANTRQDISTDGAVTNQFMQHGWTFLTGDGANKREAVAITFDEAYDSIPVPFVSLGGAINGSNPDSIDDFVAFAGAAGDIEVDVHWRSVSTTGFTIEIVRESAALTNGMRFGVSWWAIGTKARS